MTSSRKYQLIIVLLSLCICDLSFCAEPNEPDSQLRFNVQEAPPRGALFRRPFIPPDGSSHCAVLFVKSVNRVGPSYDPPIEAILKTDPGKMMSPWQREIVSNKYIQLRDSGNTISNYNNFQIFGVTEEDTKKMVAAFLEVLEEENKIRQTSLLSRQQKLQDEIAQIEKQILQKEKEAKKIENTLKERKEIFHYLSAEEAKKAAEELNRTLDQLNIEIVGIKTRLETITSEHVRLRAETKKLGDAQRRAYETTIWPRLEQMRIDETIELKVSEAKKDAAERIRRQAEEFYYLSKLSLEIEKEIIPQKKTLSSFQKELERVREELSMKDLFAIPPKVFKNEVTIFPVAGIRKG